MSFYKTSMWSKSYRFTHFKTWSNKWNVNLFYYKIQISYCEIHWLMKRDLTEQRKAKTCFPVGRETNKKQDDSVQRTPRKSQKLKVPLKAGVWDGMETKSTWMSL